MSGPWDDYKPQTQASSGPWDQYAPQQQAPIQSQLPPGVPWKSDNLQTTPSSFWKDALPGQVMQSGDENSSIWQKAKDLDQAAGQAGMQFVSGLVSPINSLIEDITGPNFLSRRIKQVEDNQQNLTPQAQSYNQNINNVFNVMDPGQIGHGHVEFPERQSIKGKAPIPEEPIVPKTEPSGPWDQYRQTNPTANQSPMPGAAGAFDNIVRQTAGEIPESRDITNTPMERMTDTLLNGKDQAAEIGHQNSNDAVSQYWAQRQAEQAQQDQAAKLQQIQDLIQQRQTDLEQGVARQTGLDMNAAERQRQLNAPTGYQEFLSDRPGNQAMQNMVDQLHQEDPTASQQPELPPNSLNTATENLKPAQDASNAMAEATRGITYENVPPDGVIPRDSMRLPNGEPGLVVPRGNEWARDENGIPVRKGMPQPGEDVNHSTAETVNGILNQDTSARNDLGNAIQEANGPKLGPDEHFGAGSLENTPYAPPSAPRRYKNSQRGSVNGDLLNDMVQGAKKWFTGSPESGRTRSYSLEEQSIRKNAELQHAGPGQYITQDRDLAGVYGGPNGRAYEVHEPFKQPFDFNTTRDWGNGVKQSGDKVYKQLVDKLGSKSAANAYLKKSGFDAITFTSPRGEKIANIFNSRDLSDIGPAREPAKPLGELSLVPMDTPSEKFNVEVARAMRGKGPQSGVIDGRLAEAAHDLVNKATDIIGKMATAPFKAVARMLPEDHMAKVTGEKDFVYKPEPGDKMAQQAVAQGKMDTSLWKNVQSGLGLAAEKTGSIALRSVGDWLNWSDKRTHLDNKNTVDPVHKIIKALPQKDFETLHKAMMREQGTRTLMSPDELKSLSPKAQEAYTALRTAFKQAFDRTNATLKAAGKPPINFEEAYHASQRYGDWKSAYYDKNGKLIWYDSSASKLDGLKAQAWLKNKMGDKIDWTRSKGPQFGPDSPTVNIPRDVLKTYQEMMKFMDPNDPTTTLISDSIQKYNEEKATNKVGYNQRFLDKNNIPGFEGNKPWLADSKNAENFFNGQMKYLRDTNHWNNFQEALNNINPILKNEDLIRNQPNIMDVAAAHVQRELGISGNMLADIEKGWARLFPKVGMVDGKPTVALGISRGNVYKGVADVKAATYLTMLGANVPYMITTPLQAAMSVAQHRALTLQGYDHNVARTTLRSIQDIAGGLAVHAMDSMAGKKVDVGMSDVGKRMLKYAEDNGILDKTVMDETGNIRTHAFLDPIKKTIGATITAPEKVARWSTFTAFAHHLLDSGKLSEAQAFKMAEDFTNHSLTSMRRSDKPLIVDKFGTGGQLGYVFKSYLFNEYNQLSQLAGLATKKGQVTPLAVHAATLFALGGALAMPGINELDSGYSVLKNLIAKFAPSAYINKFWNFNDIGIRGTVLRDLPTWASIGSVSDATKTNVGSRFSTQTTDIGNPLGDVAVPIQEGKEIMSLGEFAVDPTMRNAIQALHANSGSTVKGAMETHMDAYKNKTNALNGRNPDGTQTYIKASDINSTAGDYKRTPEEESRRALGFYGDQEYKTKQIRYANNAESERQSVAYGNMMKLMVRAAKDGNDDRAKMFAQKAITLNPDSEKFTKTLDEAVTNSGLTPEERDKIHADNIVRLKKVQRATQ